MATLDMDSITDEFEVINDDRRIEDPDEENFGTAAWSVQQSICIDHTDNELANSPASASLKENASLMASNKSSETSVNGTITKESPILEGSIQNATFLNYPSVQSEAQTTLSKSSIDSDFNEVEYNERTREVLNSSIRFFDEMEKKLSEQKEVILSHESNAKEYENRILQLENQLRADSEERKLLKERVDGHDKTLTRLSSLSDTNSIKSDNEKLRAQLAEEVAKRAQERELLKLAESRIKDLKLGSSDILDSNSLAKELCRKTDYIGKLEQELEKTRKCLEEAEKQSKLLHEENENKKQIIDLVYEDQSEALRQIAEKEQIIHRLQAEIASNARFPSFDSN